MQSQTSDMFVLSNSNTSHNGNYPISYSDQAFSCCRPFSIDSESNQASKQENNNCDLSSPPPLSFFHFPSPPFEDTEIFLQHHHDFLLHQTLSHDPEPQPFITVEGSIRSAEQIPRRKHGKKDRHSKINTARGLRDRRMRLSLEVAKRFFGLQDMLGFDKASKTVEWLLNQAKVEINQLERENNKNKKKNHHTCCSSAGAKSAASTSECEEGVSSLDEVVVSGNQEPQEVVPKVVKRKKIKHSRKSAFHPLAKECRKKARERARERTKEKMRNRGLVDDSKQCREDINHDLTQLGSWNPFGTGEQCGTKSRTVNPSLDVLTEAKKGSHPAKEHLGTVDAMAHDDALASLSKWGPSMIFSSLSNSGFPQEVSLN
ncbi:transcription factor DICHOTOMA-like [Abrus precatorius]|uniref:Transcription factor DICHOTOMA-like n=1 Tax=Abrus precatorius TaxID=3816 RepID=A0A8B8JRZ0_ABRPR|nr:transcription factor DICHOTOMA-like [Abrus precatorius]